MGLGIPGRWGKAFLTAEVPFLPAQVPFRKKIPEKVPDEKAKKVDLGGPEGPEKWTLKMAWKDSNGRGPPLILSVKTKRLLNF
jgi:hypothetical protein